MITIEQVEEAFGDSRKAYKVKDIDHTTKVITLLRERIPYDIITSIVSGAEHDVIYLCNVEESLDYLSEEDLEILADCNCWLSVYDCFALFT